MVDATKSTNPCKDLGDVHERIPGHLKKGFQELLRHESTVLNYVNSSPEATAKFLADPATVLSELKIPLDNNLAAILRAFSQKQDLTAQRTFCLPDGTQISPKIKVTLVSHRAAPGGV